MANDPIAARTRRINGQRVACDVTTREVERLLAGICPALQAATDPEDDDEKRGREVAFLVALIAATAVARVVGKANPKATAYAAALATRTYLDDACTALENVVRKTGGFGNG